MNALKFTLTGRTAFFKKPDVNTYLYFTYGHIHKVALLGIFGAILGYKGYNQMNSKDDYPEFYNKLKNLKISIVPKECSVSKKIQVFNNSVGYASKEQGGNLIVNEQWLENPSWDIYVLIDNEEAENLSSSIINNKYVYLPYLGKNDHPADIIDAEIITNIDYKEIDELSIDSMFLSKDFEFIIEEYDVDEDDEEHECENIYKYEEALPVSLNQDTNGYELEILVMTNQKLKNISGIKVYKDNDRNIVFF